MKRVLVTGATGFVGRIAAIELAARGFEVHGTSRRLGLGLELGEPVAFHLIDVLHIDAMSALIKSLRPTHLLLSAWTTKPGEFWADPRNNDWTAAMIALAQAFFAAGGKRAVLAGSCAEYDWSDTVVLRGPIRESDAQGLPHTPYGRAKRQAAEAIARVAIAAGGEFANGRLFFPMGPGENHLRFLPEIICALLAGQLVKLGPCDQIRDIIDVRDAGAALAALVISNVIGPVNVGSGKGIRLGDMACRVGDILGRNDLIKFGALPPRAGEPAVLMADIARLCEEVGFKPYYTLDETIEAALAYWRALGRA